MVSEHGDSNETNQYFWENNLQAHKNDASEELALLVL